MALAIKNLERPLNKHFNSFIGLLNKQTIRARDKPFKETAKRFRLLKNIYLGTEIKLNTEFKETDSTENTGPLPWIKEGTNPVSDLWYFRFQGCINNHDLFSKSHECFSRKHTHTLLNNADICEFATLCDFYQALWPKYTS